MENTTNVKVIRPGAVIFNQAYFYAKSENIVCIYVDLNTKHAVLEFTADGEYPSILLGTNENTIGFDKSCDKDAPTELAFTDFPGWIVFTAGQPCRYTVPVVLVKRTQNFILDNNS